MHQDLASDGHEVATDVQSPRTSYQLAHAARTHTRTHRGLSCLSLLVERSLLEEELDGDLSSGVICEVRKNYCALSAKPPMLRALQSEECAPVS